MRRHPQFLEIKSPAANGEPAQHPLSVRLPSFIGGPADAAAKLGALKIAIVGVGSVGGRTATHLARLGVAELWLVDPKFFKAESVLTHDIEPGAVGKSKVLTTARRCKAISPATRVFVFNASAAELPLNAFADLDLVVMATDNLAAEIEVGQRCVRLGKPLIQASVHGDTLTAQVRFFGNADNNCPCPACGFGETEWRMLNEQARFSCEGFAAPQPVTQLATPPTMSVSSLCSLVADLAMNQILRIALLLGVPVLDTCIEFCGFTNRALTSPLTRNANCPVDHRRYELATAKKPLAQTTLTELANTVAGPTTFTVDSYDWIESGVCRCATPNAVRRFLVVGRKQAGRCPKCNWPVLPQPIFTHRTVAASLLNGMLDRPLRKLGAANARCVLVSNGGKAVLVREPKAQPLA